MDILAKLMSNGDRVIHLDLREEDVSTEELQAIAEALDTNNFVCRVSWKEGTYYDKHLKKKIEDKVELNYRNFKPYPNDFVHSLLSEHVYLDCKAGDNVQFPINNGLEDVDIRNKELKSWKVYKIFNYPEASRYYSVAYLHEHKKQLVLAHRGTSFQKKDLLKFKSPAATDLDGILGKQTVEQQQKAFVATEEVIKYANRKGFNVSFTGHSLGAWLAEICVYYCVDKLKYFQAKAVTFDSPGSAPAMECLTSNVKSHETNFNLENLDISTYLSAPNFVNCCNQHIGKVYRVFPNINLPGKTDEYTRSCETILKIKHIQTILMGILSVYGHSMAPIVNTFDPVTGKPRDFEKVMDWPHIKYQPTFNKTTVGALLDSLPVVNFFPGLTMLAYEVVPKPLFWKCLDILDHFLNGNITIKQYLEVYEHLQFNAKEGFSLKDVLSPGEKFDLFYKGHYYTQKVDPCKDVYNPKSKDWYLHQLWELKSQAIIKKEISSDVKQALQHLKDKFNIKIEGFRKYIYIISSDMQVDDLRDEIVKLCEVYSEIKEILVNKNAFSLENGEMSQSQMIMSNVPYCAENIVERPKVLDEISSLLSQHKSVVISAFGGTGKSTIAKEFGRSLIENFSGHIVQFIVADSLDKINEVYKGIAENELRISVTGQEPNQIMRIVHSHIKKSKSAVLFIFDNVESSEHVKDYIEGLCNIEKCGVIITTRQKSVSRNLKLQSYELDPFTREEAQSFIEKNLDKNRLCPEDIEYLIDKLGTSNFRGKNLSGENLGCKNPTPGYLDCECSVLPYSLSHAVAYLDQNPLFEVKRYLEDSKNSGDTTGTFLLLDLLKTSELSFQILQFSAYLDPDYISIDIFRKLFNVDEITLNDAVKKLEGLSLVKVRWLENGRCGLQLHRLVQHWVKEYAVENKSLEIVLNEDVILERIIQVLNKLFPIVTRIPNEDWKASQKVCIHAEKILQNTEYTMRYKKPTELSELIGKLGNYKYAVACDFTEALKLFKQALVLYQKVYIKQDNNPNIDNLLDANLQINQSYPEYTEDFSDSAGQVGEINPKKDLQNGEILHCGQNHPQIANILQNLAETWHALGNVEKALEIMQDALKMRRALYPRQNHPDIATSLDCVGILYIKIHAYDLGIDYLQYAFEKRQALYPEQNHSDIATSLYNLGATYFELGDYAKALNYGKNALEMRQALFPGQNHPDIAGSLLVLGAVHSVSGDYAKALDCEKDALVMRRALYPRQNHPDIVDSLHNLGGLYTKLGDIAKALQYLHEALERGQALFPGPNHPIIAAYLHSLGVAYHHFGDHVKASEYLESALEMRRVLYHGFHPKIAESLQHIGLTYDKSGDHAKALEYKKNALEMSQLFYREKNHPEIAECQHSLALTYFNMGWHYKALDYQEKALKMRRALYPGQNHPDIAECLYDIGTTYYHLRNHLHAVAYLEEALLMYERIYPTRNHPNIAATLHMRGLVDKEWFNYEGAIYYTEQALEIRKSLYSGQNHRDILASLLILRDMHNSLGDNAKASHYEQEASEMSRALYPEQNQPDHDYDISDIFKSVANIIIGALILFPEGWTF